MADIQLNQFCTACLGTGIRHYNVTPGSELQEENPCSECNSDGKMAAPFSIEPEWFDAITEELTTQAETLSDMADKINDILDKCNDIFEKVNE